MSCAHLSAGTAVRGKDQIRPSLRQFLDLGDTTLDMKDVVEMGDLAFLVNRWSLTGSDADGGPFQHGRRSG